MRGEEMTKINHHFRVLTLVLAAALASSLIMLVVPARLAEATVPGDNGNYVYSARDGDSYEIYVKSSVDGRSTRVTPGSSLIDYSDPAYQPYNGGRIAFVGRPKAGGDYEIYTVPDDGGAPPRQLTNNTGDEFSPDWSPDGTKIAYASGGTIYVMDADGGTATRVTPLNSGPNWAPDWSPDGQWIAYEHYDGTDYEIYKTRATGNSSEIRLTDNAVVDLDPSWRPDGQWIAYENHTDTDIYRVPASGASGTTAPTKVYDPGPLAYYIDPTWSADGAYIAFLKPTTCPSGGWLPGLATAGGCKDIFKVPWTGGSATRVTNLEISNDRPYIETFDWQAKDTAPPRFFGEVLRPNVPTSYQLGLTAVPITLTWSAWDPGRSGIDRYYLQRSTNGGDWKDEGTASTATSRTVWLEPSGNTYQFRIYATDKAGNRSGWVYGPTFTVTAYQEDSASITYSGEWLDAFDTPNPQAPFGGAMKLVSASETGGETARFSFTGRDVAWVGLKFPSGGHAYVWVDGVKESRVDLYSSTQYMRQPVFVRHWDQKQTHQLEVRAFASSTERTVVSLDAFIVLDY